MADLPKCKLCGSDFRAAHDQSCALAMVILSEDEWRRLHGPGMEPEHVATLRLLATDTDSLFPCEVKAIRAAIAALGEGAR